MDQDFEIEIQEDTPSEEIVELMEESEDIPEGTQLPLNFLTFGEIENDDVKVYIKQDVYKALEELAASDTTKELGSIILGDYCQEHDKTHVVISEFIEAKYTDASASTLTFTHETWDYVHSEHEENFPECKIIGWQHTHPNYGIFLSNYDLFIQENFFNLPFQVAYVIDPIQNLRGFFQWKNGKIEKLKGYYIYDDVGKPIKIEQVKVKKEEPVAAAAPSKGFNIVLWLLCAITLVLTFCMISLNQKYEQQLANQKDILAQKSAIEQQNMVIQNQAYTISQLQAQLASGVLDSTNQITASQLLDMLNRHETQLGTLEDLLKDENLVVFKVYTVVKGDSLTGICQANGLDYERDIGTILTINGIADPDRIYVGQRLLLPYVAESE